MHLVNPTHLEVAPLLLPDATGAETLLVIVKGTWIIERDGTLSPAGEQVPIRFHPVYRGQPGQSSLLFDSDVVLQKPGTDCLLNGHAWAPRGRVGSLDVTFAVGPVRKTVRVFGERIWQKRLWFIALSKPKPFESIPLAWEHAFGGADTSWPDPAEHVWCQENPVGRGVVAAKTKLQLDGLRLPNLENPASLIETTRAYPAPAGFGPIPIHWHPRAALARGAHRQAGEEHLKQASDHHDVGFYSAAAPGLMTPQYLSGAEPVWVENAAQGGALRFALPGVRPQVRVRWADRSRDLPMALDTVTVEPDEKRVSLVWRGTSPAHGRVHGVHEVRVGLAKL